MSLTRPQATTFEVDTIDHRPSPRYRGRDRAIRALALFAILWGWVYLAWRIVDTRHGSQPEMFYVLYVCEIFGWAMLTSFTYLAWRVPVTSRPKSGQRPTVDIFVCTYDESVDVLSATLVGCDRVTYPHTTWLLDDGRRPEVRDLAQRFGARYLTRKDNQHAKAGNINNALKVTGGQLLLMLDADHVPQPDILDALVGYFDDPKVAVVQSPHDFSNRDSFQHFSPSRHDQSVFFEVMMPGKDRHNAAFWCGSAALIRREALESIGGIATETIAEDFHTTIRLHGTGWRTCYHDETLVQGLAPQDLASFLLQRDRWARGNLAVLRTRENPIVARGLTLKQRLSYLSSLLAYFVPLQRLGMLAVLATMLVSGRIPVRAPIWQFALLWLPWMILDLAASRALTRGQSTLRDGSYTQALTTEIFVRAAISLVHPITTSFKVTPKDGIDDGGWAAIKQLRVILAVEAIVIAAVSLRVLAMVGLVQLPHLGGVAEASGLFFGGLELAIVAATLWKVGRRHQVRRSYREDVAVDGSLEGQPTRIVDLTPRGASVTAPQPIEIGSVLSLRLRLTNVGGDAEPVQTTFTVRSCREQEGVGWCLGGTITPASAWDEEVLIEFCHVVSTRRRLIDAARLVPGDGASPSVPGVTALDVHRSESPPKSTSLVAS